VLDGYPLWTRVDSVAAEDVASALARAVRLVREATPGKLEAARAHGARFTRDRQLGPAITNLRGLVR
jgi:hypothetical protein